jgi:hypothetical protein
VRSVPLRQAGSAAPETPGIAGAFRGLWKSRALDFAIAPGRHGGVEVLTGAASVR